MNGLNAILNGTIKCSKCFKILVTYVGWYHIDDLTFDSIKRTVLDHAKECAA